MLTAFPRGGTLETYKRNIFIHLCSIFDRKLGIFGVQKYRSVLRCRALHTKALISLSRFHTTSLTIKRPDDPHANFPVALDLPTCLLPCSNLHSAASPVIRARPPSCPRPCLAEGTTHRWLDRPNPIPGSQAP